MDPDEPCRCGHERKWHNSCSRCYCPWFLPEAERKRLVVAEWKRAGAERKASEVGA